MSRVKKLEAELERANARIAELEKAGAERPLTMRRMKEDISRVTGIQLSGPYAYGMSTVNREDLIKIRAWIMERAK